MILYHGSTVDIERIDLQKSKPNKDFGRAFYLSADYDRALDMAKLKRRSRVATRDNILIIANSLFILVRQLPQDKLIPGISRETLYECG